MTLLEIIEILLEDLDEHDCESVDEYREMVESSNKDAGS